MLYFIGIFFATAIFLFFWQRFHWSSMSISLKDQELHVLVAKNIYQQYKGLGGRKQLAPYDGMIFPFYLLDKHTFVMRDMEFPIDIVWLKDGVVVDIAPNVPIEPDASEQELARYYPRTEANLVLELQAGWTQKNGLKIGDVMTLPK